MSAKIGLIGLGWFAKSCIIPGIKRARGLELAAIYDQSAAAVREVAETLPAAAVCSSASELIQRRDLDVIYVATPSGAHKELVEAVIGASRHIVCEKPLTTSHRDAAYLASLAGKAGLVNAVDHEMRYSAIYRGMRQRIRDGYVGNLVLASLTFSSDYAVNPFFPGTYYWNFGSLKSHSGGILRQHMSHMIDLYHFMLGGIEPSGGYCATMVKEKPEIVESVSSTGERAFSGGALRGIDTEDSVAVVGRLPNGAPASITATWSAPVRTGTRWMIQGDQGVLIYQSGTDMGGLWGDSVQGARAGEDVGDVTLPAEIYPDVRPTDTSYLGAMVGAELEDVVRVIGGGENGMFATFETECEVWRAIEAWNS